MSATALDVFSGALAQDTSTGIATIQVFIFIHLCSLNLILNLIFKKCSLCSFKTFPIIYQLKTQNKSRGFCRFSPPHLPPLCRSLSTTSGVFLSNHAINLKYLHAQVGLRTVPEGGLFLYCREVHLRPFHPLHHSERACSSREGRF